MTHIIASYFHHVHVYIIHTIASCFHMWHNHLYVPDQPHRNTVQDQLLYCPLIVVGAMLCAPSYLILKQYWHDIMRVYLYVTNLYSYIQWVCLPLATIQWWSVSSVSYCRPNREHGVTHYIRDPVHTQGGVVTRSHLLHYCSHCCKFCSCAHVPNNCIIVGIWRLRGHLRHGDYFMAPSFYVLHVSESRALYIVL